MIPIKMSARRAALVLATVMAGAGLLAAADDTTTTAVPSISANGASSAGSPQADEIARLKAALAEQQKQLQSLQQMLEKQQQMIEKAVPATQAAAPAPAPAPNVGTVASLAPMFPNPAPAPAPVASAIALPGPTAEASPWPQNQGTTGSSANPCEAPAESTTPAYLRIGSVCIAPVGFMDMTAVWRSENTGGSIGSSFGSIPLNSGATGRLSEFRLNMQNSRLGFRIDGNWMGAHFIGYNEFDFLGTSGSTAITVTNGAVVPRARLYWVDVRKGAIEFLAGQSWSLLTPNRTGISPLPGNIFFSQVMDVNYIVGLTWTRQPGFRVTFHPSDKVAFAFAAENADTYIGGSGGGSTVVLPTALTSLGGTQLDTAAGFNTSSVVHPDFIAKLAFDPDSRLHFEVAGIERTFKVWDNVTNVYNTKVGGGVSFNLNAEIVKNFRIISNNYWSDGGGRYMFGEAPDLVLNANGSISPLHSGGLNEGFEATHGKFLFFGYYGGAYVGRDTVIDANGNVVGYGYKGSSQNRYMQEVTFGANQTIWRNPRYGAINLIYQYAYETRSLWYWTTGVAGGKGAKDDSIYFDIRYTLPGAAPNFN
jgi:hypothetical protein